jgi:predicted O-methyltransferase YrrM
VDDTTTLLRRVDDYVQELFAPPDEALEAALRDAREAGLPEIHVSPAQGKLLYLLTLISGARRVLEIGTLGAYSTIHLARALPEGGELISLELDEEHAEVARRNVERAGLSDRVQVVVGEARDLLAAMVEEDVEPFDLVFIDADKDGYPEYLERAIELSRPGTVILGDNAIRGGTVLDAEDGSPSAAIREFNRRLAEDSRLEAVVLPILRERVDGLAIARVKSQG